jgi:hypothetical protein
MKIILCMIRFTSQLSVADCYQQPVIFFVHVNMKQFYERERKGEQRRYCSVQWRIRFLLSFCFHTEMRSVDQRSVVSMRAHLSDDVAFA